MRLSAAMKILSVAFLVRCRRGWIGACATPAPVPSSAGRYLEGQRPARYGCFWPVLAATLIGRLLSCLEACQLPRIKSKHCSSRKERTGDPSLQPVTLPLRGPRFCGVLTVGPVCEHVTSCVSVADVCLLACLPAPGHTSTFRFR